MCVSICDTLDLHFSMDFCDLQLKSFEEYHGLCCWPKRMVWQCVRVILSVSLLALYLFHKKRDSGTMEFRLTYCHNQKHA